MPLRKDDCDNTRFDITFRSDYPKTYEEYVERIKSLLALGIPVCILAQKKTTITMIRKYRALGIHQFILNDDKLAARIKQEYPEVRLTLSITRALTLSELKPVIIPCMTGLYCPTGLPGTGSSATAPDRLSVHHDCKQRLLP